MQKHDHKVFVWFPLCPTWERAVASWGKWGQRGVSHIWFGNFFKTMMIFGPFFYLFIDRPIALNPCVLLSAVYCKRDIQRDFFYSC
jgi:hypothetical protein